MNAGLIVLSFGGCWLDTGAMVILPYSCVGEVAT